MKITLIREERESGKEAVSTQETDMLMEKLKTENKTGYITELRIQSVALNRAIK